MRSMNIAGACWTIALSGLLALAAMHDARAAATGAWNANGAASASASALGIGVNHTGSTGSGNYSNVTYGVSNTWWTNPYGGTVSGGQGLGIPFATLAAGSRNYTVTFSEAVDNPILHVSRIGGSAGATYNSTVWNLSGFVAQSATVTMQRLSGNAQFVLDAAGVAGFRRTTGGNGGLTNNGACSDADTTSGCGSIRFNGTGITSLTFTVTMRGGAGNGDQLDFLWTFQGSRVIVAKQSIDGTGSFAFSGNNGIGSLNLSTAAANPVAAAARDLSDHAAAIEIDETPANGFGLTSASCVDQNNAAVASTLTGQRLSIAAADYRGNQTITCTFVNTRARSAALSITKNDGADGYAPGGTTTYVLRACNAADASAAADGAAVVDQFPAGLSLASAWTCSGSGGGVCSAGSGGAAGDTGLSLSASALPAGGCVSISVPVDFASEPTAY